MTTVIINSDGSLSNALGDIREIYKAHHYLRLTIKTGKDRSLDQNAISHAWYTQLAKELREDDARGWKRYCKLTIGVPILRAGDEDFRDKYDRTLRKLAYEQKLEVMDWFPVTSLMTKAELSSYLGTMQMRFADTHNVMLEFPPEAE